MMTPTLLTLHNAAVKHFDQFVFNGLHLEITKGEHWAFVGESGSGKSTLLNAIAGKQQLSTGEIKRFFADDYLQLPENRSAFVTFHQFIAMVDARHHFRNLSNTTDFYYQQRYNSSDSDDALTVLQYLSSVPSAPGVKNSWNINNTIQLLKLDALAAKQLIKLSNGETKRLMIAAALLRNPLLLVLDNPLAGLDVDTRKEFNHILQDIAGSGITILIAVAPDEIPEIITHVGILEEGKLQIMAKNQFSTNLIADNQPFADDTTALKALLADYLATPLRWVVKMDKVRVKYGDKLVLDDIDWAIQPGERWALLGPNGAGKSTLLSLINGDNPQAYANSIVLFDKKRGTGESIWDIKRKTGFISPELFQYFPTDHSCLQVIESGFYDTIGLFRASEKLKAERCLQWMKVLEIDQYARTLLRNVPTGAQRLCLLARAMVKNPILLILDEPCQGLDQHQQQHFKQLIDTICGLCPVTIIYVTHYQHQIPESVTQVLRLNNGGLVSE